MATLELSGITKTYGSVTALEELDLDIGDGEFFVLLGPSGAGKTTTLKSVAGLQEIDAGRVTIAGQDMTGIEPYHRNVAMAFESYALYPQKTVFDNLASPLRSGRTGSYTAQDQQQRIELVTTTLGINHLLQRFPRELSNGQRQRVALGRVLVRPGDVYLLDEPLSHLDAKLRAAMRAELKHLGEMSNTTTLYVTHDYQEALALGDRIGVLRKGRLVQVGTPEEVWNTPVDSFVARALGQPEMNLLDARVVDGQVVAADGQVSLPAPRDVELPGDGRLRIGIRPRDLEIVTADRGDAGWLRMRGTVRIAERLGRAVELDLRVGDTYLIAVTDSDNPPGEREPVEVQLPPHLVHLFAAGEEGADTLRLGAAAPAPRGQESEGETTRIADQETTP